MRGVFDDKTPEPIFLDRIKKMNKYTPFERATGKFVLKNKTNGQYIERVTEEKTNDKGEPVMKVIYRDVEDWRASSAFDFRNLDYVHAEMLNANPNIDVEYFLVAQRPLKKRDRIKMKKQFELYLK